MDLLSPAECYIRVALNARFPHMTPSKETEFWLTNICLNFLGERAYSSFESAILAASGSMSFNIMSIIKTAATIRENPELAFTSDEKYGLVVKDVRKLSMWLPETYVALCEHSRNLDYLNMSEAIINAAIAEEKKLLQEGVALKPRNCTRLLHTAWAMRAFCLESIKTGGLVNRDPLPAAAIHLFLFIAIKALFLIVDRPIPLDTAPIYIFRKGRSAICHENATETMRTPKNIIDIQSIAGKIHTLKKAFPFIERLESDIFSACQYSEGGRNRGIDSAHRRALEALVKHYAKDHVCSGWPHDDIKALAKKLVNGKLSKRIY